ncbi:MAG: signal peptidase II [Chloroflexi bacterium]|nr:signal peptidase II [Chloroflexota bacterium]
MTVAAQEERPEDTASRPRNGRAARRWVLFGVVATTVVITDQLSKRWVDAEYALTPATAPTPVLGDLVRIAKGYNDGGIFGLFGDSAALLGLASLAVITLIFVYQVRQGASSGPLLSLALGLLMGGAVGNLIDRIVHGHVIDFVDMGFGTLRWYTFNVADAAISVAIVLLVALSVLGDRLPGGSLDAKAA